MKKSLFQNWLFWFGWVLTAGILHLFGNNSGTLAVLVSSILIPPLFILPVILSRKKFQIQIDVPDCKHIDELLSGTLRVYYWGILPISSLHCFLHCENTQTGESSDESCIFPMESKIENIAFSLNLSSGGTLIFSVKAFAVSVFGLFFALIPNRTSVNVNILSDVCPLMIPDPSETQAIREYLPGDSIRSIHWKLSQKTDTLMVREYGQTTLESSLSSHTPGAYTLSDIEPEKTGLHLQIQNTLKKSFFHTLVNLLLVQALLWGIIGSLLSMVQRTDLLWTVLPGALLAAFLLLLFQSNKNLLRFGTVLGTTVTFASIAGWHFLSNGFGTFFNLLFSASEQHQAYIYDRFISDETTGSLAYFLIIISIVTAFACALSIRLKGSIVLVLLCLVCFGLQVYLGVFPSAVWLLVLFFAFAVFTGFSKSGGKGLFAHISLVVLLTITAAVTMVSYTGQNRTLNVWSESIRDQFDEQIAPPFSDVRHEPISTDLETPKNDFKEADDGMDAAKTPDGFVGATIGTFKQIENWAEKALWMLLGTFLLYNSIRLWIRAWKMYRYRKQFHSADISIAIRHMFPYQIALLQIGGLKLANVDYLEYVGQLQSITNEKYSECYQSSVMLWHEAAFSEHLMTENQRMEMRTILDQTTQTVSLHSGFWRRYRLNLFKVFGRIGGGNEKKSII